MRSLLPGTAALLLASVAAEISLTPLSSLVTLTGTNNLLSGDALPTGTYESVTTTLTVPTTNPADMSSTTGSGSTVTGGTTSTISGKSNGTSTSTSDSVTLLVGQTSTLNGTAPPTSTLTSALPTNTQPCNGYVEFCARNYSNITNVAAHNSPFVRTGNFAANQMFPVTTQLNDGVRMLQFQTHVVNDTVYLCHTTCDILNAGTLESYLSTVVQWLEQNPFEVLTLLMGNGDLVDPGNFTQPVTSSGLLNYLYTPPEIPMALHDWPTLSSMILTGKRVVFFMDYQANQTEVPWLLDEFSQMWETAFSPVDRSFPCAVQRPPNLGNADAENRLYTANHNLNLDVSFAGANILIPNTAVLNETNAVSGFGSLGWMAGNCTIDWHRPPNFLLVDYYNTGNFNGSVFEVAAAMNNVTYNHQCCGTQASMGSNAFHSHAILNCLFFAIFASFVNGLFGLF